jgi:hypothetical protein
MYLGLDADHRRHLEEGLIALVDRAGGSLPLSLCYILVTARAAA